jgi:hypothetical protein
VPDPPTADDWTALDDLAIWHAVRRGEFGLDLQMQATWLDDQIDAGGTDPAARLWAFDALRLDPELYAQVLAKATKGDDR